MDKITDDSQTWSYSVDRALYHHRGTLAGAQVDDVANLVIFYRNPWLTFLVFLEHCCWDNLRNVGKNGTYDNPLVTLKLGGFLGRKRLGFRGLSLFPEL